MDLGEGGRLALVGHKRAVRTRGKRHGSWSPPHLPLLAWESSRPVFNHAKPLAVGGNVLCRNSAPSEENGVLGWQDELPNPFLTFVLVRSRHKQHVQFIMHFDGTRTSITAPWRPAPAAAGPWISLIQMVTGHLIRDPKEKGGRR